MNFLIRSMMGWVTAVILAVSGCADAPVGEPEHVAVNLDSSSSAQAGYLPDSGRVDAGPFPDSASNASLDGLISREDSHFVNVNDANDGVASPPPNPQKLRWAPPTLTNPEVIELGNGETHLRLDDTKDYIVKLPRTKKVGVTQFTGGHHIVMIGGYITVAPRGSTSLRRGIYIKQVKGTVHLEGILIDSSGGGESDGIAINAPEAIVQAQNMRIVDLRGSQDTEHADVIQPWGGVRELRVDKLTGSSNYQGLQIPIDLGPIGRTILSRVNLFYSPAAPNDGGYLLWLTKGNPGCDTAYPVVLDDVYLAPKDVAGQRSRDLGNIIWPPSCYSPGECSGCEALVQQGTASWPALPQIQGSVHQGAPPNGDFVPAGTAGLDYVSPGYR